MKSINNSTIASIKRKIVPLLKQEGIKKAGIFGSYARGEAKKNSDIDILVEIRKDLSLLDIIKIQNKLEDILGKKVDLIEYKELNPLFRKEAIKEEVRIL